MSNHLQTPHTPYKKACLCLAEINGYFNSLNPNTRAVWKLYRDVIEGGVGTNAMLYIFTPHYYRDESQLPIADDIHERVWKMLQVLEKRNIIPIDDCLVPFVVSPHICGRVGADFYKALAIDLNKLMQV